MPILTLLTASFFVHEIPRCATSRGKRPRQSTKIRILVDVVQPTPRGPSVEWIALLATLHSIHRVRDRPPLGSSVDL